MTRALLVAAAALLLAAAAAGCGGSDDSSSTEATQWADGFCTAVSTWKTSLTDVKDQFTDLSSFSEESFRNAADDVQSATDTLVQDLKDLGAPDTDSGQEVKSSLDDLASTLETESGSIQTTVENTSGITKLPGAARDILASLSAMSTAFSSTLSTIDNADVDGELEDAFESSSACSNLTS